jgi:adenylate cyclase
MGLQTTDPERADENAGLIAQHFERAGDAMKAAEWHLRAIGWAGLRDPMASIRHALQIVELDDDIPNDADGDLVRLSARLYVTTMGWRVGADPAITRKAFDEGVLIAERTGNTMVLALLHTSFAASPLTCEGRLAESVFIATEAARLADDLGDPGVRVLTLTFLPYLIWLQGRLEEAVAMFDELLELTADNPDIPFKELIGSPRAWALAVRGSILCCLGRQEEGRRGIDEAIELAEVEDGETLGWVHMFATSVHFSGGEMTVDEVVHHAQKVFEIAERLGDAFSRSWARLWLGYAALVSGDAERAIEEFTRTLSEIEERGAGREALGLVHRALGTALVAAGEVDRGIEVCRGAIPYAVDLGSIHYEMWAREALGVSLLRRGAEADLEEAAEQLNLALEIAERMGHVLYVNLLHRHLERIATTA